MELRTLGGQGLTVSAQGLGLMGMSAFYGSTDEAESLATIDRALELGVTLFDTAEIYGPFTNEQLLGKALTGRREQAVIATKTGIEIGDDGAVSGLNGRPEYIRRALDRSLRHLGTDHVDLYYLHRVDPQVPIEETVGAMGELVDAGKVRHIGLSEAAPGTIRRAHAIHPLSAVQTEYSLFERGIEQDGVMATLNELGIGLVAYAPLGRGFLSGAITSPDDFAADDYRRIDPRYQGENFQLNLAVVDEVRRIAAAKQITPPSWPSPGSCTRARSPSPAPSAAATWKRTAPQPPSPSPHRSWPPSTRPPRTGSSPATATPPTRCSSWPAEYDGPPTCHYPVSPRGRDAAIPPSRTLIKAASSAHGKR